MTSIVHQPEQQRFIADVDGSLATLDYSLNGQAINFTSTYVPFSLRGQGYAEKLVDTGLSWAREQGYDISASCWYVARYLSS